MKIFRYCTLCYHHGDLLDPLNIDQGLNQKINHLWLFHDQILIDLTGLNYSSHKRKNVM